MSKRDLRDQTAQDRVTSGLPSRRTVAKGLAWSVPVVAVVSAAPAFAASCETFTFGAGSCKCPGQSTPDNYGYWLTICYACPPNTNANDTTLVTVHGVTKANKTPLEFTRKNGACADLPYEIPLNGCSEQLHFTGENSGNFLYIDYTIGTGEEHLFFKIPAPPDCGAIYAEDGVTVLIPSKCDETGGCPS